MKYLALPLFFLITTILPGANPIWDYHHRQMHAALKQDDWYAVRQALGHLKARDAKRYREEQYDLTAAWIASREENWDSVYRLNRMAGDLNTDSVLEMATGLEEMGRYNEALAQTRLEGLVFRGRVRWDLYALRARCYRALGETDRAVAYYRKLTTSSVPPERRIPAYRNLLELYYATGERERARRIAEYLQKKRPGSDAALFSVAMQESRETQNYLARPGTLKRFASVYYRNRAYQKSDTWYTRLEKEGNPKEVARARYFLALTHLKKGRSDDGLTAFEKALDQLKGTDFEGVATFQYARTLFLNHRDEETIRFVEEVWRGDVELKWRRECLRLLILALRRAGDPDAFDALGTRLKKEHASRWLHRFYHRNGVVWAMSEGRPGAALSHLQKYRRYRLKWHEKHEAILWEGLIQWELGHHEDAIRVWLRVAGRDPNHYFGLVAREFIRHGAYYTKLWQTRGISDPDKLPELTLEKLKELYFIAPDPEWRGRVGAELQAHYAKPDRLQGVQKRITDSLPHDYAHIGRFDRAARSLKKKKGRSMEYHYLKARWYLDARQPYDAIRHAEFLADNWPRWMPYELMPEAILHLMFPKGYARIVHEKADIYAVDPYLLLAIIREESRFNSQAKSWASARGLMQFIPDTALEIAGEIETLEDFSLSMLYNPDTAITLGARYVDKLMHRFDGIPLYTVAAYNAGEGAVHRWNTFSEEFDPIRFVWDVTYDETKFYCQKVLRAYHHYTRVYEKESAPQIILTPELAAPEPLAGDAVFTIQ